MTSSLRHPNHSKERCILIFVRAPVMGKVKRRLGDLVGHEAVLLLYKSFVNDQLDMLRNLPFDVTICYHPSSTRQLVRNWLIHETYFMAQSGENLGQRMKNAFEKIFSQGYRQALLIGSDLPTLPSSVIHDAFDHLDLHDAVIGPCEDGGYYLVGFCKDSFSEEVFSGISWGTAKVFDQTLIRLNEKNINFHLTAPLRDIDEYIDLLWLKNSLEKNPGPATHTYNCIMDLYDSLFPTSM